MEAQRILAASWYQNIIWVLYLCASQSWITCIGAKIICIYIYILRKKEKQDIWGIILRCLNPYLRQGYGSLTAMN